MRMFFLTIVCSLLLVAVVVPVSAFAQTCPSGEKLCGNECIPSDNRCLNLDYPRFGPFDLNINQNLTEIIGYVYYFIVGIAGLAAFVMLVWGGVQWLLSGAIPSQASEAKEKVRSAILGLLLVLSSFLIVQVINPELTVLRGSVFEPIDCTTLGGACEPLRQQAVSGFNFMVNGKKSETVNSGDSVELSWNVDPTFYTSCQGASSPSSLWAVSLTTPADFIGSATVGPITTSLTSFTLSCFKLAFGETNSQLFVSIASAGPSAPPPVVDLKIDPDRGNPLSPSDGPLTVSAAPWVDVYLSTRNAVECWGGPYLATIISGLAIPDSEFNTKFTRDPFIGAPPPYQVIFDVTCFNATGQNARDEVIMDILPP